MNRTTFLRRIAAAFVAAPLLGATAWRARDDTDALQHLINLADASGDILVIPPAAYRTSRTLVVPATVAVVMSGSRIDFDGDAGPAFDFRGGFHTQTSFRECFFNNTASTLANYCILIS